jgi:WD40 repeat protein
MQELHFSPDGTRLMMNEGTRVWLWDVDRRSLLHTMKGFYQVTDLRFSANSRSLVVTDSPRWIGCFDVFQGFHKRWVFRDSKGPKDPKAAGSYFAHWSPDGKYLLAVAGSNFMSPHDHKVLLLDAGSGKLVREYPQWSLGRSGDACVVFAPDSAGFVRAHKNKLQYYSLPSGEKVREVTLKGDSYALSLGTNGILCHLVGHAGKGDGVQIYSTPALTRVAERMESDEVDSQQPDGPLRWIRKDGKVQVLREGAVIYQGVVDEYVNLWVPGGGFMLRSVYGEEGFPQLRDAKGEQLGSFSLGQVNTQGEMGCAISGRGTLGELSIYDLRSGAVIDRIAGVGSCKFSGDGRRLAINLSKGVLILDVAATLAQGKLVALPDGVSMRIRSELRLLQSLEPGCNQNGALAQRPT